MKALVYAGPGKREVRDVEKPRILNDGDAIVKLTKTTICGTGWRTRKACRFTITGPLDS